MSADVDVSRLPPYAFGHRSILWWATAAVIVIESMMFALGMASYFYLRGREESWPPGRIAPPALLWGTLTTAVLLLSGLPNALCKRAAERLDRRGVCVWLWVAVVFGSAFLWLRWLEFGALNCRWSTSAYGSTVYLLLGLHTLHQVTDFLETLVLAVLLTSGPAEGRRFVDVAENADYWYFVVGAWLPLYAVLYWGPRWL
jgi:cytochrome c oxidase subunit III